MVFPVSVELAVQQLGSQILFTARLFELTNAAGVVTIDERGIVQSCNKAMLNIFGLAAPNDIVGRNVSRLMPEPYASFHDSYLKRYMQHGQGRIVGAEGRYVMAKVRHGREALQRPRFVGVPVSFHHLARTLPRPFPVCSTRTTRSSP